MKYSELVEIYSKLEKTPKRLQKTSIISDFLSKTHAEELPMIIILLQGRLFPQWDDSKSGVAGKIVEKSIQIATGRSKKTIETVFRETGDLGSAARTLVKEKKQQTLGSGKLSVDKVYMNLCKLSLTEGLGSVDRKVGLIAELLALATPLEAQYIIRTVLEDLRVGVGDGSIRDAIVWTFFDLGITYDSLSNTIDITDREEYVRHTDAVQEAYNLLLDFGRVAKIAKEKGLKGLAGLSIEPGRPIKVMLFQKAKGVSDAFDKVGRPAALEYKYDGFRLQTHKNNGKIRLFTRSHEDVTKQFPDIVANVKKYVKAESFIIDSETIGIDAKTGKYLPFQSISQRIKRKHDIERMVTAFPVEINVFDILFLEGKSLLKKPFRERRDAVHKIIKDTKGKIAASCLLITDDDKTAQKFYDQALREGNEGIMVKKLDAIYKPGSRVGFGVKVKPVMKNLDLVITASEWGEGKRSGWLTSFALSCRDKDNNLLDVGRVGTGIKELDSEGTSFAKLTKLLTPLIISEKGTRVRVKPEIVIEVTYEEIQESKKYSSGYALRFPRFMRLREDRDISDIDNLETIEELYSKQRNR